MEMGFMSMYLMIGRGSGRSRGMLLSSFFLSLRSGRRKNVRDGDEEAIFGGIWMSGRLVSMMICFAFQRYI
jgi:hypothetical protein